jgi:hypothetical protein
MSAKSKRPAVFDIDEMLVKPTVAPEPAKPQPEPSAPAAGSFRTSVWLSRAAHEILREIAHVERKPFAELFREGLDHVLSTRKYPTIGELEDKNRK